MAYLIHRKERAKGQVLIERYTNMAKEYHVSYQNEPK
jgi:hypothetical protein